MMDDKSGVLEAGERTPSSFSSESSHPGVSAAKTSFSTSLDVSMIHYLMFLTLVIVIIVLRNFIWIVIKTGHRDLK